jgi:hypothetical protein
MATIINEVLLGRPSTAEVPAPEANKSAAPDRGPPAVRSKFRSVAYRPQRVSVAVGGARSE